MTIIGKKLRLIQEFSTDWATLWRLIPWSYQMSSAYIQTKNVLKILIPCLSHIYRRSRVMKIVFSSSCHVSSAYLQTEEHFKDSCARKLTVSCASCTWTLKTVISLFLFLSHCNVAFTVYFTFNTNEWTSEHLNQLYFKESIWMKCFRYMWYSLRCNVNHSVDGSVIKYMSSFSPLS